jgi:hypothetical protein
MTQLHHYLFDSSTGFSDSTTATTPVNYTPVLANAGFTGKINQCLYWTYEDDQPGAINGPYPPGGSGVGSPWSMAFWIKKSGATGGLSDVMQYGNATIKISNASGTEYLVVQLNPSQFAVLTVSGGFLDWVHIFICYDGYNNITFYLNGTLYSSTNYVPYIYGNVNNLGISYPGVTLYLDDLRFYDDQVSGSEVIRVYNSGAGTQYDAGSGSVSASGSLATITMSGPTGSATGSSGGSASASGALSTITMSGPAGSASSSLPGSASGLLATITVSSFSGIGGVSVTGSGSLSTITVSSFTGIAFPEFIGTGSLSTVSVIPIEAVASISTSIQLSYVACDAEIGWKQSLPITGFVSAVQGEDAISARITPVVSGTEANIVFFEQRTLTASSSYTYDLQSLTDFLGQSFSLSRAYAISVVMTSGSATISPGASNPLKWFFNSNTANVTITSGNSFLFAQKASAIVSGSAKTILVTNPSALSACVYKIAILGGR